MRNYRKSYPDDYETAKLHTFISVHDMPLAVHSYLSHITGPTVQSAMKTPVQLVMWSIIMKSHQLMVISANWLTLGSTIMAAKYRTSDTVSSTCHNIAQIDSSKGALTLVVVTIRLLLIFRCILFFSKRLSMLGYNFTTT